MKHFLIRSAAAALFSLGMIPIAHAQSCLVDVMKMTGAAASSPYGVFRTSGSFGWHQGLDLVNGLRGGSSSNNPIYAGHSGRIEAMRGGYTVLSSQDGSYKTIYMHMNHYAAGLGVGSQVQAGQPIGYMGDKGSPGAIHLHLGMSLRGDKVKNAGGRIMKTGGGGFAGTKRSAPLTADQIAAALPTAYYFTNPEPFLSRQIPWQSAVIRNYPSLFANRVNRTFTLPTTCQPDTSQTAYQAPMSTSESGVSSAGGLSEAAGARSSNADFAVTGAQADTRSFYLDMARMSVQEAQINIAPLRMRDQTDSVMANMILLENIRRFRTDSLSD